MNFLADDHLRRDWIEGLSGEDFHARVAEFRCALGEAPLVICESNPLQFAVEFFAAVSKGVPIVLTNPSWGTQEQDELEKLLALKDPDPGSILIPTGGTTGGVKLAVHNWQSLVAASVGLQAFLGGGPINSCCVLPLYHVSGFMQLVRSFISDGRIRFDDLIVESYCLSLVPTQLQRVIRSEESTQKLNTACAIFVGGGPMSKELAEKARQLKLPIIPVYGMTETAAMCAAIPSEDFLSSESAGAVAIGDATFSIEADGRIRIQSSALFQGYHGRVPIDSSSGYLTDDLGRLDAAGRLHVESRADRIIITGGEKVDPSEVESALCAIPEIEAALVLGRAHAEWGQEVVAFIQSQRVDIGLDTMKGLLRDQLASYKIPKQVYTVAKLPLDEKGKIDHAAVRKLID